MKQVIVILEWTRSPGTWQGLIMMEMELRMRLL